MDLRQLRYFVGIVQAGSLSRAADQMHVAQSAISHHLASLESELERQLVTRGPKGIQLTEAGSVLYRHAEAILRHLESAKHDARSALNVPSGRVSVGFPMAWAGILGYELLARVRSAYPQILLHLSDTYNSLLRERLFNGRLDIAVLFADQPERGLKIEPLLSEELFYVTAVQDNSPVRIADVAQRPLLMCGPNSTNRRLAQEAFRRYGVTLTSVAEIDTLSTLRQAVAAGLGNTILSWSALNNGDDLRALRYRRFADAKLTRTVALCFSEVGHRSPAVDAVGLTLKSLIQEIAENAAGQGIALIAADGDLCQPAEPISIQDWTPAADPSSRTDEALTKVW